MGFNLGFKGLINLLTFYFRLQSSTYSLLHSNQQLRATSQESVAVTQARLFPATKTNQCLIQQPDELYARVQCHHIFVL